MAIWLKRGAAADVRADFLVAFGHKSPASMYR